MRKKVNTYVLKDMLKYIEDLNLDNYESSYDVITDPSVIEYARNYYDSHLPVDVTAWTRVNLPNIAHTDGKKELQRQIRFVRDNLCPLLFSTYEEMTKYAPLVISDYYSEGFKLPVYKIESFDIKMILMKDFYKWIVSVDSCMPLDCFDSFDFFNSKQKLSCKYCYGLPKKYVYGSYNKNHSQFTFELSSYYDLYAFTVLLRNYLGIKRED